MELPNTVIQSLPPSFSLASVFPLVCHFPSLFLFPTSVRQGEVIICAGVLICHMGPCCCNQNRFWVNLCTPFEHAQSYTHRLPGFIKYPLLHSVPTHNLCLTGFHCFTAFTPTYIMHTSSIIQDSCRVYLNMYMGDRLYLA